MFTWKKLGNLFCPDHNSPWMVSHAANPFPVFIDNDLLRVYFSSRDEKNRSYVTYVELDCTNNFEVVKIANEPVITPGSPGLFDDSGASLGCIVVTPDKSMMFYYLGWNLKVTVPWQNSIGLAIGKNYGSLPVKARRAPIVDRNEIDPFSISYPFVLLEDGKFKMWYGSNLEWGSNQTDMNHVIKYAESNDGVNWERKGIISLHHKYENEYAISKPFIAKINNRYLAWYSFRGHGPTPTYRIGYAESLDGMAWERKDEHAGITVSENGWDSEMICYPSLFTYQDKYHMLYNGNGYGKTGFGLAVENK